MIVYDPDANWIRDLLNFYRSKTLNLITLRVLFVGIYMAAACYLSIEVIDLVVDVSPILYTSIGVGFSLLLVFRTNTAYDRWWEGRKKWGLLVNHTRHLALILDGKLPKDDKETRRYFAKHIANYPFALGDWLRQKPVEKKVFKLSEEEQKEYDQANHKLNYFSKKIIEGIQQLIKKGQLSNVDELQTNECLLAFSNITGACERIKNTPIPFSYNTYIKIFILIYTISLPFAFVTILGYYTIILGMFEFFFLIGVEMMGEEIEDPFDDMSNDLPMMNLSEKIRNDVHEILEVHDEIEPIKKPKLYEYLH